MKKSKIRHTELIEILDESDLKELSEKVDINFDVIKELLVDEKKKLSTDDLMDKILRYEYLNK